MFVRDIKEKASAAVDARVVTLGCGVIWNKERTLVHLDL